MDLGIADRVEFWDYQPERTMRYLPNGVLSLTFRNVRDVAGYLNRFGAPDLFVNYGARGISVLDLLEGQTFRVHVPCYRTQPDLPLQVAECYLVDAEEQLNDRSMLYIPVVNTAKIRPADVPKERDFIYLASCYPSKRHDLLLNAVRGTELTGHLHPVREGRLDLSGTHITTSAHDERSVVELLQTSRIAVYAGDNGAICGGKHLVVPGVTGELAPEGEFLDVMRMVLAHADTYKPREYFEANFDTVRTIERHLAFFREMGWQAV